MGEINIENLLKRPAMLEEEKDYAKALRLYNSGYIISLIS